MEAHIRIGDTELSEGCSMALRVAVIEFMLQLNDPEFRESRKPRTRASRSARASMTANVSSREWSSTTIHSQSPPTSRIAATRRS